MPLMIIPWLVGGGVLGGTVWGVKSVTEGVGKYILIALILFVAWKVWSK